MEIERVGDKMLLDKRLIGTFIKINPNHYEMSTCKFKMRGTLFECMSKLMSYEWEEILETSCTSHYSGVRFERKRESNPKRFGINR
jgi:hypothetical protein